MSIARPQIGKCQLIGDSDEDATAALNSGWRIDHDDWWFRPRRDSDREVSENDCSVDDEGPVLAPDARSALNFDAAIASLRHKFGYEHMIEMREIERNLMASGLGGVDLYFASIRQYEERHKDDPSYRERHKKWIATSSTQAPADLIRQALEQIRDGHNDPRSLARNVLAIAPMRGQS